jgi:hypothetical protein
MTAMTVDVMNAEKRQTWDDAMAKSQSLLLMRPPGTPNSKKPLIVLCAGVAAKGVAVATGTCTSQ